MNLIKFYIPAVLVILIIINCSSPLPRPSSTYLKSGVKMNYVIACRDQQEGHVNRHNFCPKSCYEDKTAYVDWNISYKFANKVNKDSLLKNICWVNPFKDEKGGTIENYAHEKYGHYLRESSVIPVRVDLSECKYISSFNQDDLLIKRPNDFGFTEPEWEYLGSLQPGWFESQALGRRFTEEKLAKQKKEGTDAFFSAFMNNEFKKGANTKGDFFTASTIFLKCL